MFTAERPFFEEHVKRFAFTDHAQIVAGALFHPGAGLEQLDFRGQLAVALLKFPVALLLRDNLLLQAYPFTDAALAEPEPVLQPQQQQYQYADQLAHGGAAARWKTARVKG